jgi:hypothetical protein
LADNGKERTLRTIFTHDHMSPSTHQQTGLYAGLVVEPESSLWYLPNGERMNSRLDGGPTNWEGYIVTADPARSYREFALEFQDTQLAYNNTSIIKVDNSVFQPKGNPTTGPAAFDAALDVTTSKPVAPQVLSQFLAALDGAQLPAQFPSIFASNGIPLSPNATVTVLTKLNKWQIQEPTQAGGLNAGASYIVWATNFGPANLPPGLPPVQVPTSLYVATPGITPGWVDPANALNAPSPIATDLATGLGKPFPQLISDGRTGIYSMNYRNESVIARVAPSAASDQLIKKTDLAYVFDSLTDRNLTALNSQPIPGSPINPARPDGFKFPPEVVPSGAPGVNEPGDPFTPLMRAYAGDDVEVRVLVGAHTLAHAFQIQGVRWSYEPGYPDSGYKNAQAMGISEHFEMIFKLPRVAADHKDKELPPFADYLVSPSSSTEGLANGDWTIMRAFAKASGDPAKPKSRLAPLPNNPLGEHLSATGQFLANKLQALKTQFDPTKGKDQVNENVRVINVTATTVFQALPEKKLSFNPRNPVFQLDNILLFVRSGDLDANGQLKPDAPREPLILRARAGEWILVYLTNALSNDPNSQDPALKNPVSMNGGTGFNNPVGNVLAPRQVGLHPALLSYDITQANGINIGFNPDTTVAPGATRPFLWYAGDLSVDEKGAVHEIPIEFGATNLVPAEMMVQPQFGMVGALVIEPAESTWNEDQGTHASALVTPRSGSRFREFVLVGQNIVANNAWGAFNFRTEPFNARNVPGSPPPPLGYAKAFSNQQLNPADPAKGDPVTPIFRAAAGTPVRFRFVMPSTTTVTQAPFVFRIHGHGWQEEPFTAHATRIGHNPRSQYFGAQQAVPYEAFNFVLDRAGGEFDVVGDFLYETYLQSANLGTWGLFRVESDLVAVNEASQDSKDITLSISHQPSAANAGKAVTISISSEAGPLGNATKIGDKWFFTTPHNPGDKVTFTVKSSLGGSDKVVLPLNASPACQ